MRPPKGRLMTRCSRPLFYSATILGGLLAAHACPLPTTSPTRPRSNSSRSARPAAAGRELPQVPRRRQAEGRPAPRLARRPPGAATPARRSCPASRIRAGSSRPSATATKTAACRPRPSSPTSEIGVLTAWVKIGRARGRKPAIRPRRCRVRLQDHREDRDVLGVPAGPAARRAAGPNARRGPQRRSTASSWPSWRRRALRPVAAGRQADPAPPRHLRPDRPAADAARRSTPSSRTSRPTPSPRWSIGCWPRRTTASAGPGTGSTWPATARTRRTPFRPRLYPDGYRYRDWVVEAFNDDLPYDRFVTEQIAGDLLDGPRPRRSAGGAGLLRPGAGLLRRRRDRSTSWTTASTR